MMERFIQPNNDPLALVSDASVQQYPTQSSKSPQFSKEPSLADHFQLDSGSPSTENLIESLSTHYSHSSKTISEKQCKRKWCSGKCRSSEQRRHDSPGQGEQTDECDAFDYDVIEGPTFTNLCSDMEDNEEHVVQSNVSSVRNDA
ncbi:hypothetical protein Tco_1304767 [Tanacetum coccineum]